LYHLLAWRFDVHAQLLRLRQHIRQASEYTHQRGMIHRDIKPANIKPTLRPGDLMDFGIVKSLAPTGNTASAVSHRPVYVPEMIRLKRIAAQTIFLASLFGMVMAAALRANSAVTLMMHVNDPVLDLRHPDRFSRRPDANIERRWPKSPAAPDDGRDGADLKIVAARLIGHAILPPVRARRRVKCRPHPTMPSRDGSHLATMLPVMSQAAWPADDVSASGSRTAVPTAAEPPRKIPRYLWIAGAAGILLSIFVCSLIGFWVLLRPDSASPTLTPTVAVAIGDSTSVTTSLPPPTATSTPSPTPLPSDTPTPEITPTLSLSPTPTFSRRAFAILHK
jgi:serine/threonine protein kinase